MASLGPKAAQVTNITVHMGEYYFNFSETSAPVGTVVFTVINDGDVGHDFKIGTQSTAILEKGQTATLTVNFTTAGTVQYLCTVGEHAIYGMAGLFTVTGGGGGGGGTTTTPPPPPITATAKATLSEFKIKLTQRKKVRVKRNGRFVRVFRDVAVKSVKAGRIKFNIVNVGKIAHNFEIGTGLSPVLKSGGKYTLIVPLTKPGSYKYICSITGHEAAGMKGVLKVIT